jgi:hypothetical protein
MFNSPPLSLFQCLYVPLSLLFLCKNMPLTPLFLRISHSSPLFLCLNLSLSLLFFYFVFLFLYLSKVGDVGWVHPPQPTYWETTDNANLCNNDLINSCWRHSTDRDRGSQRDVVYLGWPKAPSYMVPNAEGGGVAGTQPRSTAVHMEPKKTFGNLTPQLTYG